MVSSEVTGCEGQNKLGLVIVGPIINMKPTRRNSCKPIGSQGRVLGLEPVVSELDPRPRVEEKKRWFLTSSNGLEGDG